MAPYPLRTCLHGCADEESAETPMPILSSWFLQLSFGLAAAVALYAYIGYPLLLSGLSRLCRRPITKGECTPSVSLVVPAHNEERIIQQKLENSLALDYPQDRLEILVASDGSNDGTNAVIREFADRGLVRFYAFPVRRGKAAVLNEVIPDARGDLVLFSDANVMYATDAIRKLVQGFMDPQVGCVSGNVILVNDHTGFGDGESAYYRMERFIQDRESRLGSIVGADGAMFALRRELFQPIDPRTVLDDFVISMNVARKGFRLMYEGEAKGFERASLTIRDEFRRRKRVAGGIWQVLMRGWGLPTWRDGFQLFAFLSHKLARWIAAFAMAVCVLTSGLLAGAGVWWGIVFGIQVGAYATITAGGWAVERGWKIPTWLRMALYFVLSNAATVVGILHAIFREETVLWQRGLRHPGGNGARTKLAPPGCCVGGSPSGPHPVEGPLAPYRGGR